MKYNLLKICLFLILGISLSSQSIAMGDGPPKTEVDINSISGVVPQLLPKSKYGNPESYVVNGKRYAVLKEATGYDKTGIASWYGTKFHNKKTSNGETYDMLSMTAASKELPLPTYVLVTNLDNNKQIIVKINDRGPFHEGRIIDLSYAAAMKIGMVDKGTANVRVTALNTDGMIANSKPVTDKINITETDGGLYYIQIAKLKEEKDASLMKQQLNQNQQFPVIVKQNKEGYAVTLGPVSNNREAQSIIAHYRANGFNAESVIA